jgi:predicted transcriptional regulator
MAAELLAILPPKHIPVTHTERQSCVLNALAKAARAEVVDVLRRNGDFISASEVANARGITVGSQIVVLNRLVESGEVQIKKGKPNTYRATP